MKKNIDKEHIIFLITLFDVFILSIGHAIQSSIIVLSALFMFSFIVLISPRGYFLPLMLFYLPWSSVLKLKPDMFTFHSLIAPVIFLIIFYKGLEVKQKYSSIHIVLPLLFAAYTLLVKLFNGLILCTSYISFILMMFFIPMYVDLYKKEISFEKCTMYLTGGILSACIASRLLMKFPHMLHYISVYEWEKVQLTRLSGFYGDPNYYSAQILVAIAALLITIGYKKKKVSYETPAIIALLYFGMLSISKMFVICLVLMFLLWTVRFFIMRRNIPYTLIIIVLLIIIFPKISGNKFYSDTLNSYLFRFRTVTDLSSLTTDRNKLIATYVSYLFSNVDKLCFGIGLSDDQVRVLLRTNNAHNTIIQSVYQIGLVGCIIMAGWWVGISSKFPRGNKTGFSKWVALSILACAIFLPWMALDILYFSEFFYFILFFLVAKSYLKDMADNALDEYIVRGGVIL